jgi:hypothetical protein
MIMSQLHFLHFFQIETDARPGSGDSPQKARSCDQTRTIQYEHSKYMYISVKFETITEILNTVQAVSLV